MLVTSVISLEEELATLRAIEVGGGVTDRAVMPGLKTDKAMSFRGTVFEEDATTERFGRGQNIPQLLDEGVLTVGVGAGAEGRNAVLKAKPMIIDIRANLTKMVRSDDHSLYRKKMHKVTALTDLTCSVIGFNVTFLVSRPMSWKTP